MPPPRARATRSAPSCGGWLGRQRVLELMTRADPQLGEDLVQVVLHGAAADEQPRSDVRVRDAVASESCDLGLLNSEVIPGLNGAFADPLAGGQQLALGAFGKPPGTHLGEHPIGSPQLLPSVHPSVR